MPRILQLVPSLNSGGVERGTIEIARALTENKIENFVASNGGPMAYQLDRIGTKHFKLNLTSKNPLKIFTNARKLKKIIKENEIDLVHARSRIPAWVAHFALKKNKKVKFVTTFHGIYSGTSWLKKKYNSIMLRSDHIISVSDFISKHIVQNYKFAPLEKLTMIHRGIDLELFNKNRININKVHEYISNWYLPADKKIILLPGRITSWKGHNLLIKALSLIDRADYLVIMLGDRKSHPKYVASLNKKISDNNLQEKIQIHDNVRDIENIYHLSDFILSTSSRPEPFGRVISEAAAMGKIVIATNHGGAAEQIKDNQTGFLVTPDSAEELAEKIELVLDMKKRQKQEMEKNAITRVEKHFSLEKMQKATIKLYKELVS